jgi:hypothetical protein
MLIKPPHVSNPQRCWLAAGVVALALTAPPPLHALSRHQPSDKPAVFGTTPAKQQGDKSAGTRNAPAPGLSDSTVTLNGRRFDLAKREDVSAFAQTVKRLRALSGEEKAAKKTDKKAKKKEKKEERPVNPAAKNGGQADDQSAPPDDGAADAKHAPKAAHGRDWSAGKVRHGLKALDELATELQSGETSSPAAIHQIQEIAWAVESNFVTPYFWRPHLEVLDLFYRARDITLHASGRGNADDPASDLSTYDVPDLSKVDPKPSTFWSPPASMTDRDLYRGFGRDAIPDFAAPIYDYDVPHKGYGVHPSFEVVSEGKHWKVKFGEERSSGPFACRIYSTLGYPAEIVDYMPEVKVSWDRRILSDFNSRKLNAMHVTLLGVPLTTVHAARYFNPFDFIRSAVMKDGSRLAATQLRSALFPSAAGQPRRTHMETNPALYDRKFEKQIDYLVMADASITSKDSGDAEEIGAWDYNSIGHPDLRELRGLAVLDAWLDNWDVRWGNNRLMLAQAKDGTYRLEHTVSDVGALFGNSSGMIRTVHGRWKKGLYQDAPNDYNWTFTHAQAPEKSSVPIKGYMPDSKILPFYKMNIDDARWMARRIAQLTEAQIKAALIAAGYDAPVARLLLEKLVCRRDQMVKDLGLGAEIPPLRAAGVDRHFSYNPETDGPFEVTLAGGERRAARSSGEYVVVNGYLRKVDAQAGRALQSRR